MPVEDIVAEANLIQQAGTAVEQLKSLLSIDGLIGGLKKDMETAYGSEKITDNQTWSSATSWGGLLGNAGSGGGGSDVGGNVKSIEQDFPVTKEVTALNTVNPSKTDQTYYSKQAQTAVASMAASQYEFDHISDQIAYQKKLESEIQKSTDLKTSVDLQNKLQIENNLILLGVLRQMSVANQQKALETQEDVNSVYQNASFLNEKH